KIAYEVLATPLTYAVVNYLKRREQLDVYDPPGSLNPLMVFA
ncbi:MAG: VUT family protein, partial [Chloroflexi bacterium]|nr:VUT family protein [Chloroflexota bacterium]